MKKKLYTKPLAEILMFRTQDIMDSGVISPGVGGGVGEGEDETEIRPASATPQKPFAF